MKNTKNYFRTVLIAAAAVMLFASACVPFQHASEAPADRASALPTEQASALPADQSQPDPTQFIPAETEETCKVLFIDSGSYGYTSSVPYDIKSIILHSIDESKVGDEKTFEIAGKQFDIVYSKTVKYVLRNLTVDQYDFKEEGQWGVMGCVRFFPDGSLFSLHSPPGFTIDIGDCADAETVRELVLDTLGDAADVSGFNFCDILEPDPEADWDCYEFSWYNMLGGIKMKGGVSITVYPDGYVSSIILENNADFGLDNLPDDLNLEDYYPAIDAKLTDIFGEDLVSYQLKTEDSYLTNIDGSPSIVCRIGIRVKIDGSVYAELCDIAIIIG